MNIQEQILRQVLAKVNNLDLIAGVNGTIKLSEAGSYSGPFKAIHFSKASVVTTLTDANGEDKDEYFTDVTYDAEAGDILVANNMQEGNRFSQVVLASGSAIIIT